MDGSRGSADRDSSESAIVAEIRQAGEAGLSDVRSGRTVQAAAVLADLRDKREAWAVQQAIAGHDRQLRR